MYATANLKPDIQQLTKDAMRITGCQSQEDVIILALQELIRLNLTQGICNYFGKLDLDIDLDVLRDRHDIGGYRS